MVDRKWAKRERELIAKMSNIALIDSLRMVSYRLGADQFSDAVRWRQTRYSEDQIAKELRRRLKGGKR